MGNTSYPDELEKSRGLILQYNKEKEGELLCKKKYNKYNNNKDNTINHNNNNNNNNDEDDDKNDNKTGTVGAIVEEGDIKRAIERESARVLALIDAGYGADGILFDPKMDKEELAQWDNRGE